MSMDAIEHFQAMSRHVSEQQKAQYIDTLQHLTAQAAKNASGRNRNMLCPCLSGKKFKKCCLGRTAEQIQRAQAVNISKAANRV